MPGPPTRSSTSSAAMPRVTATSLSREPYGAQSPPEPVQSVPPIDAPSSLHATCVPVCALRRYIAGSKKVVPTSREYSPPSLRHRLKNCVAPHVRIQRRSSPDAVPPHELVVRL